MRVGRIVRRNRDGPGWLVLAENDRDILHSTSTKRAAVTIASEQLRTSERGGRLLVYYADGRVESDRFVAATNALSETTTATDLAGVARQIRAEGKQVDRGLDAGTKALAAATYLGVPGLSALVSPEVQNAAGKGWIAVFFATLTWTLGSTLSVVVWKRSGLLGWPLAGVVAACYGAALLIAFAIGQGVLDVQAELSDAKNPLLVILVFVEVAIRTYGPLGAVLGFVLAAWLGDRLSTLVDQDFLV